MVWRPRRSEKAVDHITGVPLRMTWSKSCCGLVVRPSLSWPSILECFLYDNCMLLLTTRHLKLPKYVLKHEFWMYYDLHIMIKPIIIELKFVVEENNMKFVNYLILSLLIGTVQLIFKNKRRHEWNTSIERVSNCFQSVLLSTTDRTLAKFISDQWC